MKEKFLHEIPEKRDRFTKHFQTGDKQCVAAVYPRPVHYEEDGQWKEIDNRLELQSEDGKEYYGNRASALQVRFAKEAGKGSLVILKKDGHKISWDLAGAQDAAGSMAKGKEVPEKAFRVREKEPPSGSQKGPKEKKMEAVHLISEGDYEDILLGVDLSYHLNGEGLKENITFKTKEAAMQEIVFQIRHKGLELRAVNDGASAYGLFEKDKEDSVYTFELPYMYDAAGHICEDVELLAEAGQDMSILKVLPDKEWLSDAGRTYPVVIDPMVETIKNKRNVYDAFVKERDPAATRNYHYFRVGYESSQYGACRGFLKFKELPVIGDGSIVTKAYMNVYQYGYDYWNVNAKIPITAHAVNASWDPATITWNTQPSVSDEVLDVKEIGNVISGNTISFTPITFDVTKLIRSWYNTGNNNGICLKSMYEVPENNDHKSCGKFFASDCPGQAFL